MEQLAGTFGGLPSPISLEIASEQGQRQMLIRGAPSAVKQVATGLNSVYRQGHVEYLDPNADPAAAWNRPGAVTLAAQLRPSGPDFLAIKTWREFEGNDPLDALLGAFDDLQPGERVLSQVIIHGSAPDEWASPHLRQLAALKRRGYGADAPAPTRNIISWVGGAALILVSGILLLWAYSGQWQRWLIVVPALIVFGSLAFWLFSVNDNQWTRVLEDEAAAKLRDQAFQLELRLFASAATEARAREILDRLIAAYRVFNTTSGNRLQASDLPSQTHPRDLSPLQKAKPALLNVKEIAGLWHMPVGESLELVKRQTYERLLPLPQDVTHPDGAYVGISRKGERQVRVYLSAEALRRNLFVIGKTQHGKSTLMEHLAAYWIRDSNRSVLIVDPHGDLARRAIGLVPPERVNDVIYIDLSDETRSVGLNLLDVSDGSDPDAIAEDFVDVGKALWQKYWGPRMLIPLGFGLRALAHANMRRPPERQYTLLALAPLLNSEKNVREAFLMAEVPDDDRPDINQYFIGEYARLSPSQREQVISPVLSKAHSFDRSPAVRRLVGQPRSTVRLFEAIRNRKIVILNTNSGVLGADLAGFVGSLFLNVMRRVITRQTTLKREERVRVSVIADEFQTMTGTDFGALLGELQKNGGNFVLGTQSLGNLRQIDDGGALTGAIFAGVTTTVVLQVNGDDAHYLVERELDVERLRAESLTNLPPYHAYVKTISHEGYPIPVFSLAIATPLTPDLKVIAAVHARRSAYTTQAQEAERLARLSGRMIREEYAGKGDKTVVQEISQVLRDAQAVMEGTNSAQAIPSVDTSPPHAGPVVSEQQRENAVEKAGFRPKSAPPSWALRRISESEERSFSTTAADLASETGGRQPDGAADEA